MSDICSRFNLLIVCEEKYPTCKNANQFTSTYFNTDLLDVTDGDAPELIAPLSPSLVNSSLSSYASDLLCGLGGRGNSPQSSPSTPSPLPLLPSLTKHSSSVMQ